MSIVINSSKFLPTFLAGVGVMTAVMIKNGMKQMDKDKNMIGPIMFVISWLLVGYFIGKELDKQELITTGLSVMTIIASVFYMMSEKEKDPEDVNNNLMYLAQMMFVISWVLLGFNVSKDKNNTAIVLGFSAPVLVILSMMVALPLQRKHKVIDGPGMALFVLAWVALSVANAM